MVYWPGAGLGGDNLLSFGQRSISTYEKLAHPTAGIFDRDFYDDVSGFFRGDNRLFGVWLPGLFDDK